MPVKPSSHSPDDELGRLVGVSISRQQVDRDGNGGEPCLDAEALASYVDGGLSAAARAEADRHLAACGWCRRALLFQTEGAFQVEADADHVMASAEADEADEAVHLAPAIATTTGPAAAQRALDQRPGRVLAWPGVRRAARTWLPLAATVIVAAGLWFTLRSGLRPNVASPTDSIARSSSSSAARSQPAQPADRFAAPPEPAAKPAGELNRQAKADSPGREVGADAKPNAKLKESTPRPFAEEDATRALADRTNASLKDAKEARALAGSSAPTAAPASAPASTAAPAPARPQTPTFRSAAPPESTMARAKTESQPPALAKPNANGRAAGAVGGLVGGRADASPPAPPPPAPREAEGLARQAPATDRAQATPAQEVPPQTAQTATNVNANQVVNQQASGPTNTQSNVNANQTTQNAGTQNAAGQNAANQRAGATGDRADRDESRRREAPQRASNESAPATAPAAPSPASAAKAGGASAFTGATVADARAGEKPAEGKVAAPAGAPAVGAEAGAAGGGARTADGEAGKKPVDAVAKRAAPAAAAPPTARPAGSASADDATTRDRGRGLDPEAVVVTSPFPNVVRSLHGRRWWRIRDANTIEGSFDGGFTWTVEYSDPEARIAGGAVTRTDDCWMVGAKGLVLRFESGRGWRRVTAPTTRALVSVAASGAMAATVTDDGGQRYQTTDGGLTWRPARR